MSDLMHRLSIPVELKSFTEEACLLAGESRHEFETIRQMIIDDIRPSYFPAQNSAWLACG
jgi:hypothetical protein